MTTELAPNVKSAVIILGSQMENATTFAIHLTVYGTVATANVPMAATLIGLVMANATWNATTQTATMMVMTATSALMDVTQT